MKTVGAPALAEAQAAPASESPSAIPFEISHRTEEVSYWNGSFGDSWEALWSTPPESVLLVELSCCFSP